MTTGPQPAGRRRDRASRVWWAAPLVLVAATGITVAVLVAPSLAGRTTVPTRLVVVDHPSSSTAATPHPATTHHPTAHPTTTPSAARTTAPVQPATPRVVTPQRPVVTEPPDDRNRSDDPSRGDAPGGGDG